MSYWRFMPSALGTLCTKAFFVCLSSLKWPMPLKKERISFKEM